MINICSSGSSGSTLLTYILNRHKLVYSGEELGLFAKPFLYNNFNLISQFKAHITSRGISSWPHFSDTSFFRNLDFYKINRENIINILSESENFESFVKKFELEIHKKNNTSLWIEKSPENIYLIDHFIQQFPNSKIIHIVRDPKDVINSLIKRGHDVVSAAEVWLTSVANIQPFTTLENVYEIRYEDLVTCPAEEIKKICLYIGIDFDEEMLNPEKTNNRRDDFFETWHLSPHEQVNKKAIGSYKKSMIDFEKIWNMKITSEYAKLQNIKEYTLLELMDKYKYGYQDFRISFKNNLEKIYSKNPDPEITEFNGVDVFNTHLFAKVEI